MQENYPELMVDFKEPIEGNFLKEKYILLNNGEVFFDFNSFLDESLSSIVSSGQISEKFANFVKYITTNDLTVTEIQDKIGVLKATSLNNRETYFLDVYESTLLASNEYWNKKNTTGNKIKCSSTVIAADAVGAGLGLWGSPLWSIIQGAIVSIAVNEDC